VQCVAHDLICVVSGIEAQVQRLYPSPMERYIVPDYVHHLDAFAGRGEQLLQQGEFELSWFEARYVVICSVSTPEESMQNMQVMYGIKSVRCLTR
jgi:hypothetical protein